MSSDSETSGDGFRSQGGPAVETVVADATYWTTRLDALRDALRAADGGRLDPPDGPARSSAVSIAVRDPAFWANDRHALAEAVGLASLEDPGARARVPKIPAEERLTLTVEEAAALLGISRAFAYEAVARGDIPSIRIGRRILVPRAALNRLVSGE